MLDTNHVRYVKVLNALTKVGLDDVEKMFKGSGVEPVELVAAMKTASEEWEQIQKLNKKLPLTEEQASEEIADNGKVEGVITLSLDELFGQLEDSNYDLMLDDFAEKLCGSIGLQDVEVEVLFSNGDDLYVKVTGGVDEDEEDDEETEA